MGGDLVSQEDAEGRETLITISTEVMVGERAMLKEINELVMKVFGIEINLKKLNLQVGSSMNRESAIGVNNSQEAEAGDMKTETSIAVAAEVGMIIVVGAIKVVVVIGTEVAMADIVVVTKVVVVIKEVVVAIKVAVATEIRTIETIDKIITRIKGKTLTKIGTRKLQRKVGNSNKTTTQTINRRSKTSRNRNGVVGGVKRSLHSLTVETCLHR